MQIGQDIAGSQRSFLPFRSQDLERLGLLALNDLADFRSRNPSYGDLRSALIAICLAQGGAKHFIDGKNGVKDLDVWMFFRASATNPPYPPRVRHECDFGDAYFGRHPDDTRYIGRRVDILGRSIPAGPSRSSIDTIRAYLGSGSSVTPRKLAEKAVIMICPSEHRGQIVWPRHATIAHGFQPAEPNLK